MNHLKDQGTILTECKLTVEMLECIKKAEEVFGVEDQHIVMQALKEFFEKHGISHRSHT